MVRFFINRPIFAIVLALIIVIMGTLAAFQLPIAQYPQISPPTISVSTNYTGANASVVNQTVAQVIENQVNGTQGMDYMNSSSDETGAYKLTVRFGLDSDSDNAAVKVQNNVAIANASLPADVQAAGVTTKKSSNDMTMVLAIYSPNQSYDRIFLKNYADAYLLDKIKRVKGVGDISIFGSDYAMRIWMNPDKMATRGLTVTDISNAVKKQNVQAPAGTIGQLPADGNQEHQFTNEINGRLSTPEDFGKIILKHDNTGSHIRLQDVARIETGAKTNAMITSLNGQPALAFLVQLTNDANAMETLNQVKSIMAESAKDFPPDMKYQTIIDSTQFIKASLTEVMETFMEALLLVVLIVFIFLQNWRATLIPLLAVPVSLIGTFSAFIVLGFSINTLTLFAMVLAIGLVVDDAIVVIENVEHHMSVSHLSPKEATIKAMDEVQGPVVAIAFVLSAIFIPVAFLGGMTGVLYRQFALTIAISMGLSAFVALTLTPALCALMLKPQSTDTRQNILDRFFASFNRTFTAFQSRYTGMVGWLIRHSRHAVVLLLLICGLTGLLFKLIPPTFVPIEDQGYFLTSVTLPEGTSLNRTEKTLSRLSAETEKIPGIDNVMVVSGYDILSSGTKANAGTIFIGLKDWADRKDVAESLFPLVKAVGSAGKTATPEASVLAFPTPSLPGLGMVGGWTMELQDMSGHTDAELNDILQKIIMAANARPELTGVRTTFKVTSPIYKYDIDRDKVNDMGIELSDVFTAMQVNYGGYQVNDFNQFGRTYKVMLQSDSSFRSDVNSLRFMFVRNASGQMVPLNTLLLPRRSTAPSLITRFNGARSVSLQGSAASGYSSGQAIAAMEEVVRETAPTGFSIEWSGQSREEKSASNSTLKVMGLAVLFVFLCLAALYESWSVPFAVLLTIPTGILGALASEYGLAILEALMGHMNPGLQNSVYMQIGVIMIMGLAAKNAILIVEFAKVRVDHGMEPVAAAIEASRLRLRPILMTSLAFIIGCLPLAIATGAGAASRNGMGVAVVGGMLFATSLGIFLIPVFFVLTEYASTYIGKLWRKRSQHQQSE